MRIDPEVDQRAARIAERSFGFLLPSQAAAVGHTRASLRSRTANGMLERRGRLYRFRGAPESWQGAVYEAVANATPGTVAGGLTAAALFGLCVPPRRPQLVVPRTGNARQDGATVIRSDLDRRDTTRIGIIPATTPARTLIDAAALLDHEHLCGLVDAAFVARLVAFHRIDAAIERTGAGPGRRGVASLRGEWNERAARRRERQLARR